MVAWRSFFISGRGGALGQLELVWASRSFWAKRRQKITVQKSFFRVEKRHNLMLQELLRMSSIGCAKCQSGRTFDELNIFKAHCLLKRKHNTHGYFRGRDYDQLFLLSLKIHHKEYQVTIHKTNSLHLQFNLQPCPIVDMAISHIPTSPVQTP